LSAKLDILDGVVLKGAQKIAKIQNVIDMVAIVLNAPVAITEVHVLTHVQTLANTMFVIDIRVAVVTVVSKVSLAKDVMFVSEESTVTPVTKIAL